MYYMTRKLPTRICFQIWLLSIWYYVGWEWRKTKTQTNKCVQKNNSSFSPTKAVLESFSPSIIYLSEGLKDMWKWEVPIKVWDRSQRQKNGVLGLIPESTICCCGTDPSEYWDLSQNSILFTLGSIPEPQILSTGIWTSLFWVRLGLSMGHRPISSPQGLEVGLELIIWSQW